MSSTKPLGNGGGAMQSTMSATMLPPTMQIWTRSISTSMSRAPVLRSMISWKVQAATLTPTVNTPSPMLAPMKSCFTVQAAVP